MGVVDQLGGAHQPRVADQAGDLVRQALLQQRALRCGEEPSESR
ncbi:hypothetical protein [Streptomyces sp. NPDC051310]